MSARGSSVQLTTTGATRIYRPAREALPATQSNEFTVQRRRVAGICSRTRSSRSPARAFRRATTIHLAHGAGLVLVGNSRAGREARGEIIRVRLRGNENRRHRARPANRQRTRAHRAAQALDALFRPPRARIALGRPSASRAWARAPRNGSRSSTSSANKRCRSPKHGETLWGVSALPAHGADGALRCAFTDATCFPDCKLCGKPRSSACTAATPCRPEK